MSVAPFFSGTTPDDPSNLDGAPGYDTKCPAMRQDPQSTLPSCVYEGNIKSIDGVKGNTRVIDFNFIIFLQFLRIIYRTLTVLNGNYSARQSRRGAD